MDELWNLGMIEVKNDAETSKQLATGPFISKCEVGYLQIEPRLLIITPSWRGDHFTDPQLTTAIRWRCGDFWEISCSHCWHWATLWVATLSFLSNTQSSRLVVHWGSRSCCKCTSSTHTDSIFRIFLLMKVWSDKWKKGRTKKWIPPSAWHPLGFWDPGGLNFPLAPGGLGSIEQLVRPSCQVHQHFWNYAYKDVCGKPWIKGYQQEARNPWLSVLANEGPDSIGVKTYLQISDFGIWPGGYRHDMVTKHDVIFMSSHFILSLRGVFHAPGSLIKCRGSLVVRPPGIPDYFQFFRYIMLPEADSRTSIQTLLIRILQQKQSFHNSPDCMFRLARITIFHPLISTCHPMLISSMNISWDRMPLVQMRSCSWRAMTTAHWFAHLVNILLHSTHQTLITAPFSVISCFQAFHSSNDHVCWLPCWLADLHVGLLDLPWPRPCSPRWQQLIGLRSWWVRHRTAHHQQHLSYHHSLQLNATTKQRDTVSHNQCKHLLPTPRLHNLRPFTLSTHHITTRPCQVFQPLPQHNPASQGLQASPPQCVTSFTYQPTTHPTSTAPAQPLPTTSASQQYSPTNALTLPRSHAKHSRTRSRTTRKHRSTSRHRRRRRSTKQHHTCHTSRHRSTTPRHRRHTSQHRSRRRQHHSPILRSRSNFRPRTRDTEQHLVANTLRHVTAIHHPNNHHDHEHFHQHHHSITGPEIGVGASTQH